MRNHYRSKQRLDAPEGRSLFAVLPDFTRLDDNARTFNVYPDGKAPTDHREPW